MPELLTFDHFQKINKQRAEEWHCEGGQTSIEFKGLELGGEAGEVQNAIKKLSRWENGMKGGIAPDESIKAIAEELGDVVICAGLIAIHLNINLGEAVKDKFNKTSDKVGLNIRL